jgi:hypothetical protein
MTGSAKQSIEPQRKHPQSRVRNKKAHERRHHRFTGLTRPSLRNGFNGLCRAPRRRIRLVTVIGGLMVLPDAVGSKKPPPT